jgi:hypothetical protein
MRGEARCSAIKQISCFFNLRKSPSCRLAFNPRAPGMWSARKSIKAWASQANKQAGYMTATEFQIASAITLARGRGPYMTGGAYGTDGNWLDLG